MATPSSGLRRSYHCSALIPGGKFLLCGTDVGDMVVYGYVTSIEGGTVLVGDLFVCFRWLIERHTCHQAVAAHFLESTDGSGYCST